MIYLLTLLCSMCIQFVAIDFPVNISSVNSANVELLDSCINSMANSSIAWQREYASIISQHKDLCILYDLNDTNYALWFPRELVDSSYSSSFSVQSRDSSNGDIAINFAHIEQQLIRKSDFRLNGFTNSVPGNPHRLNIDSFLYCELPLPLDSVDTFSFAPILDISGHTQDGVNDYQDLQEPFSNVGFTGHSLVNSVDDTDSNNLLGNILNGIRTLGNLYVSGVNNIGHFIGGLWGNINDTINYVIEPIDKNVVNDYIQGSTMGTLFTMVGGVFGDIVLPEDPDDDIIFRWHLPSGFGDAQGSFNLSDALDGSKNIWQPLLLTCLYGSFAIGFFRSMPSMLSGSSGIVGTIFGNNSNDSKTKKGGS